MIMRNFTGSVRGSKGRHYTHTSKLPNVDVWLIGDMELAPGRYDLDGGLTKDVRRRDKLHVIGQNLQVCFGSNLSQAKQKYSSVNSSAFHFASCSDLVLVWLPDFELLQNVRSFLVQDRRAC